MTLLPDLFWDRYFSPDSVTTSLWGDRHFLNVDEGSDELGIDIAMPGVEKKDIELNYRADKQRFHIFVKDVMDKYIHLTKQIDENKIEAELSLGVLKIVAPIMNSNKSIQIK